MDTSKQHSPWMSLIILLGLTLGCSFVSQFLVLAAFLISTGGVDALISSQAMFSFGDNTVLLYSSLVVSSIGTFLLPALILQKIERGYVNYFPQRMSRTGLYFVGILAFLILCNPLMELISSCNLKMSLPEGLKSVESWMGEKEKAMGDLTEQLVMVDSPGRLILNLLVMALVPAVVEEFYFRGSIQKICERVFLNSHAAIWISAIIFSAIHLQFYGFFPRMILGLIFGYSLVWTQNIWVPVFGHFVNNASVTVLAFLYHKQGKSFSELQNGGDYNPMIYVISLGFTLAAGYIFYRLTHQNKMKHESKLG